MVQQKWNIADKLPSNECMLMDFNLRNCTKYSVSQFYMFSKIWYCALKYHQSSLVSIDSVEKNYILTTADLYFDAAVIAWLAKVHFKGN